MFILHCGCDRTQFPLTPARGPSCICSRPVHEGSSPGHPALYGLQTQKPDRVSSSSGILPEGSQGGRVVIAVKTQLFVFI